ncbi:MAG: hypothetical protein H6740_25595 [Alphaproteobacteria bacterium]|nr:hypothetical protein [Alphaproteobacteria bacterium]
MTPVSLLLLSSLGALASAECENLCTALDDVEEACEAAYGDGGFCEDIGAVEETCDPEDGGTTESCEGLCEAVDALDDDCDALYGEDNSVCQGLDALAEDCEDGTYDGEGGSGAGSDGDDDDDDGSERDAIGADLLDEGADATGCATGPMSGGALSVLLALAMLRRRR